MMQLLRLLDEAFAILHVRNLGLNHAEPVFKKILEILETDAAARQWFMQRSVQQILFGAQVISVDDQQRPRPIDFVDGDLFCFVAHATRWPEFATACEQRKLSAEYSKTLPGSRDIADYVSASLSDDWEDKDFYQTFSKPHGK
jgi:hypothetical protein